MAAGSGGRPGGSPYDNLQRTLRRNMRNYESQLNNMTQLQRQSIQQLNADMTTADKRSMKSSITNQQKLIKEQLKQANKYYKLNKTQMTQADKQATKVLLKNRKNDLKALRREYKTRLREIEDDADSTLSNISRQVQDITTYLRDWKTAIDVGDISSGIKDSVQSVFEAQKAIQKITGQQLSDLQSLSNDYRARSKATGDKVAVQDYMNTASDLASMGYKDTKFLKEFGEVMTEVGRATDTANDNMSKLAEYANTLGDSNKAKQFGNIAKALGNNTNLSATSESIMEVFQSSYDSIAAKANGDDAKFTKLMQDQMKMSAMASSNYFDYDAMKEFLDNIQKGDQDSLTNLAYMKLNPSTLQSMTRSGDYAGASAQVISALKNNVSTISNSTLRSQIMEMTGVTDSDALRKVDANSLSKSMQEAQSSITEAQSRDFLSEYFNNEIVSPIERLKNKLSNTKIGSMIEQTFGTLQMDSGDISTILFSLNSLAGLIGKMGFKGSSGAGFLSKIVGSAAGGSGALGGLANAAIMLGGGNLAGGASLSAAGLAGLGGASVAGGFLGAAGVGSGIYDIYRGVKGKNKDGSSMTSQQKSESKWSGGTKIGMVGAGAAAGAVAGSFIPVVGTAIGGLIGAGVGGIGALLQGSNIGKWLKSAWDDSVVPFFTKTIPSFFTETIPNALSSTGSSIKTFFTKTIPTKVEDFWTGVGNFFTQTIPYSLGYTTAKIGTFFTETVPAKWTDFWTGVGNFWTTTVPNWVSATGDKFSSFFMETVPLKWNEFWTGVGDFWTTTVPNWVSATGDKFNTFFTQTIPTKWTDFWTGVGNFWTKQVPDWVNKTGDSIKDFFTNKIPEKFGDFWDGIVSWFKSGYSKGKSKAEVDGKHRTGLDYVPYNGYIAELHKGETVLTKDQASAYRKVDGSHKTGLDTVPRDGYVAELHKDEAVLTKDQANQWRAQQSASSTRIWFRNMMTQAREAIRSASMTTGGGTAGDIISFATSKLGSPYVWGGSGEPLTESIVNGFRGTSHDITRNPNWRDFLGKEGYDCSGLTSKAYASAGIQIPRTSETQQSALTAVTKDQAIPGDLAFTSPANSHHVGVYLGKNQVIESPESGKVVTVSDATASRWVSFGHSDKVTQQASGVANGAGAQGVWSFLTSAGYSPQAAAGILGNMEQESTVDPTLIQGNGRGPAAGIVQWENYNTKSGRWKSMADYASSKGKDWTDLQSQLEFLDKELQGADSTTAYLLKKKVGGYEQFKQLTNVRQATDVFEQAFERAGIPMMENRYKAADKYYSQFAGGSSTPSYDVGTPWVPNDQLAMIHKGEMIVPADNNPLNKLGSSNTSSSSSALSESDDDDIQDLIDVMKWGFNKLDQRLSNISSSSSSRERSVDRSYERRSDSVFSY